MALPPLLKSELNLLPPTSLSQRRMKETKTSTGDSKGARLLLLKDTTAEELLDAIRIVHQGKKYIPPQVALKLAERLNNSLTRRELEVLQPLVVGKSNLEIGAALSITEGTAKFHVNNI